MKIIKAALMNGPNMPFLMFQFGISVQAESLLMSNVEWEEIPPADEMGNPLPEWEANQAREKGMVAEKANVDVPTMIALLENMPASKDNHPKAKGSAFDTVRGIILGALFVALECEEVSVDLMAIPMVYQESSIDEFEDKSE